MIGGLENCRIALAHDWLVGLRGGELVLDRLARLFGPTDLYTLVSDGRPLTESITACRVVTSPLQRFPGARGRLRRYYFPLMPWAVGCLEVGACDVLLSTSSCVIKALKKPVGARHVCFCHSPARYAWSQQAEYGHGLMGVGLRAYAPRFRRWDRRTADHVDLFVAPSSHIAGRIRECFDREAVVVAPPVRTELFTPDATVDREDFWLIAAALEPFKRIDLAIDAAKAAQCRLKIAGRGSQFRRLKRMAGPGVEFLGWRSPRELCDLYRRARAFIFPSVEDFGIAPVEAMACGCPVVALRGGGALDTVDETCGAFMNEQTVEALIDATTRLPDDPEACRRNAQRFGEKRFDNEIIAQLKAVL